MNNATLSSYYSSSAFDPPEDPPLPSDILVGLGFDEQLIDLLDEIEREEGFGGKINWCVAAIKCEELMLEEMEFGNRQTLVLHGLKCWAVFLAQQHFNQQLM